MRVHVGDCELEYDVLGDGDPVLFIHGFPLSGEMWRPVAERIRDEYQCIIPDLRGHGRSQATAEAPIGRHADDMIAVLDAAGESRPVAVVGLSMGGIIAFDLFRRFRPRVRALVLADTRAPAETPEGVARREALAQSVLKSGSSVAVDSMIDNLFAPTASPALRNHWRRIMTETSPVGVAAASRALGLRPDSLPTLAKIDCPALVIVGEQDAITPVDLARQIHRGIRGSSLAVIPGAGHMPPVEQPERFVAVLRPFLDAL